MNKKIKAPLTKKQIEMLKASAVLCIGNQHKTALKCIDDLIKTGFCRSFMWTGSRKHISAKDVSTAVLSALHLANVHGANIYYYKGNDAKRNGKVGDFVKILKKHFVLEVSIYNSYINVLLSDGRTKIIYGTFGNHYLTACQLSKQIIFALSEKWYNLDFSQQTKFYDRRGDKDKVFVGALDDFVSKS